MSDNQNNQEQTTLEDVDTTTEANQDECQDAPKSRSKRSLIDVPARTNTGADGAECEEFK